MPLAFYFFLRFFRFFLGFVGASAESLPGPLALDWTAILLCFGSLPVFSGQPSSRCTVQSCRLGRLRLRQPTKKLILYRSSDCYICIDVR